MEPCRYIGEGAGRFLEKDFYNHVGQGEKPREHFKHFATLQNAVPQFFLMDFLTLYIGIEKNQLGNSV